MSFTQSRAFGLSAILIALLAAALLPGCITAKDKQAELERVAKDWCLVIRASQVLPVYPLTEDVAPGDVFLTTTRIGTEADVFTEKGFLPLDNHLVRLNVEKGLDVFYGKREVTGTLEEGAKFPRHVGWGAMPRAAFPTYSVDIRRGGGLNLAIPVQGVPVGLAFLGSASAVATVTIADAFSFGLDIDRLNPIVDEWAKKNVEMLKQYGIARGQPLTEAVYLRIVSRIYYTGSVNIHLDDASQSGLEAKGGIELPTTRDLQNNPAATNAERYAETAQNLNASLAGTAAGGRLRIINVSSRSISMEEDFPAPLVIGYIAFDRPIYNDGTLGAAVPTFARVTEREISPALLIAGSLGGGRTTDCIVTWSKQEQARRDAIKKWMTDHGFGGLDPVLFINGANLEPHRAQMIADLGIPCP